LSNYLATHPNMSCSSQAAKPAACTVAVIRDVSGLDALRAEWDELFLVSPTAAPPLRWEWVRTWWQVYGNEYGDRGRGLRVIAIRKGRQLIGILPLYVRRHGVAFTAARQLGFVSTGAAEFEETCSDYLDLLHAPGEATEGVRVLQDVLANSPAFRWDELELTDLSTRSPLLGLAESCGRPLVRVAGDGTGYRSDLTGGFGAYLDRLSAGARAEGRRLLRAARRMGLTFEVAATANQADAFFDQMVALHHRRWQAAGLAGSFAPRHAAFHRALARQLVPGGDAVLARLSDGDRPLAVTYGHRVREAYHSYQRGVNLETRPVHSPGTAALLLLMEYLADCGVTCFDHLTGTNPFKERYATDQYTLVRLRATRPTVRSMATAFTDLAGRGVRKVMTALGRTTSRVRPMGMAADNTENAEATR
jgi:CelD/BcsL family acetyltransferase involved in cellulose biosynthesis